jgi:hypothetical protein
MLSEIDKLRSSLPELLTIEQYCDLRARSREQLGPEPLPYDADDDFEKSIAVAYEAVRERVADGGPPWTPKHFED